MHIEKKKNAPLLSITRQFYLEKVSYQKRKCASSLLNYTQMRFLVARAYLRAPSVKAVHFTFKFDSGTQY